jgi:tetratricopeptide (TPR) repeat protein
LFFWAFFLSLRQEAIATVTGKPAPADPWLHLHRGRVYVKLGQPEKAEAEFQAAVKVQPDDPRILLGRSRIYAALGKKAEAQADRAQALKLAEKAIANRPDDLAAADVFAGILDDRLEPKWTALKPLAVKSEGGATLTVQPDDSVLASGKNPDNDVYVFEAEFQGRIGAIRLEAIPDPSMPTGGSGRAPSWGNFVLTDFRAMAGEGVVTWSRAHADFSQEMRHGQISKFPIAFAIDADESTGWAIWPRVAEPHRAVFIPSHPITAAGKTRLTIRLTFRSKDMLQYTLGRFRLSVTASDEIQHADWFAAASTPHAKVGAAYLALGDFRRAVDFLTKATAANPKPLPADWLVLALAHTQMAEGDKAKKTCGRATELLKPTGADPALRPLLREVVIVLGTNHPEAKELIAAAAGEPPAALNDAIQQNPDKANSYRDRGVWYAERGQWQQSIADFTEVCRLEPNTLDAMKLAILLAQTGEVDRYRKHGQAVLARWGTTEDNSEADQTLKTCLFLAGSKHDPVQLARLAKVAVSGDQKQDWYEWFLFAKGLHDYRTGKYADALTTCRESRRRVPGTKGQPEALTVLNRAIEAMALHRSGDEAGAKRALAEAKPLLDHHVPGIDFAWWHDWLAAHMLYREAEALIAAKKTKLPK